MTRLSIAVVLLCNIMGCAALSPTAPGPYIDALGARVTGIRFFEKGPGDPPPRAQRAYGTRFDEFTARYIAVELELKYIAPGRVVEVPLSCLYLGVDLLGPTRLDYHWQAQAGAGFDAQHFQIDWGRQHATCPAGKTSISWTPAIDSRKNAVIKVKFSTKDCRRCDHVTQCIRSQKRYARRTLTIRPERQYQALQVARHREATDAFRAEYARRAGIEGTISRGTRSTCLRRTRYIGLARVRLGHILTAAGLNLLRLGEWFLETARAKTRVTPFARLMADAPAA